MPLIVANTPEVYPGAELATSVQSPLIGEAGRREEGLSSSEETDSSSSSSSITSGGPSSDCSSGAEALLATLTIVSDLSVVPPAGDQDQGQ